MQASYLIGIDLGTTNSVLAFCPLNEPNGPVRLFEIAQLVGPGKVAKRKQLPSFRYHPLAGEISTQDSLLPWDNSTLAGELEQVIIGEWARELGAKSQGRLVSSAKSWLSHPTADRTAALLPWASGDEVCKVSPLHASASYLNYLRQAWNHEHPDAPMEAQEIVITVPASFDEAARALTLEAAQQAGLAQVWLLEEPQAVCYDWFKRHQSQLEQQLQQIRLLLVCDIGGGTTDLSLIRISRSAEQTLQLERIAVGEHLMLGGDNVDLALAQLAEPQLSPAGQRLNSAQLSQLVQQARQAKETLLTPDAPTQHTLTLLGAGSRLMSSARHCHLQREQVQQLALNGFLPQTTITQLPNKRRHAIVEFGLPYAADAAISKHLAEFLQQHQVLCRQALGIEGEQLAVPDAILLNGGWFNSPLLQQQLWQLLDNWRGQSLQRLDNPEPDLAVALGAVAYGQARHGQQPKIQSGAARHYLLKLDQQQAVCILPRGSLADTPLLLEQQQFALRLGQPVQFHLYASNDEQTYQLGQLYPITENQQALPPLVLALDSQRQQEINVKLRTMLTEVGTLQLDCISPQQQCWQLEFEIRSKLRRRYHISQLPSGFQRAAEQIRVCYGNSSREVDPAQIKNLRIQLEKQLGNRDNWDTSLARALCDVLIEGIKKRRRSAIHERNWYQLTGFCLRPGTGYPLDQWRIEQLWPLYEQGLQFPQESANRIAWCTFWRRAAGGLNRYQQQAILFDLQDLFLANGQIPAQADKDYEEIIRLLACLENLPADNKQHIGNWLLQRLQKQPKCQTSWWALGRLGCRIPAYASPHQVLSSALVETWLQHLLTLNSEQPGYNLALTLLSRQSGDRQRDIQPELTQRVIQKLQQNRAPESWIRLVSEANSLDSNDQLNMMGDALPAGLRLL